MILKPPMDGADDIDPEETVELEVPDFSGTAAVQSLDATASPPGLIDADLLATTDTYRGLGHPEAGDHFANKLREVEERLSRQTDRLAELELEREALQAAAQQLREATHADIEAAREAAALEVEIAREQARHTVQAMQARVLQEGQQANLSREVAALRAANESQLEALRSVEGYRNLSRSLLDERDGQVAELEQALARHEQARLVREQQLQADQAAREALWATEKAQAEQEAALYRREVKAAEKRAQKQAYELAKQNEARCADLERQLAEMLAQREQQVGEQAQQIAALTNQGDQHAEHVAMLAVLMAERDLQEAALLSDAEERVAHQAEHYAALEAQLTEQTAELERSLDIARQEAAEAAEQADRSIAELLATQEALSAALRTAEAERAQLAKDWVSQARQLAGVQEQLEERDEQLKRTQAEAHASAALLGNLQQRIDRLGREGDARPTRALPAVAVVEEPADNRSRLLVQEMGGMEVGYPLQRRTTIGRTPDNDIAIDTNFISRHHAVVLVSSRHTIIEDLKSTNGIRVNGRRVSRQLLHDGDLVTIGNSDFRYSLAPQGEAPSPP